MEKYVVTLFYLFAGSVLENQNIHRRWEIDCNGVSAFRFSDNGPFGTLEEGTWAAWLYDLLKPQVQVLVCLDRSIPHVMYWLG